MTEVKKTETERPFVTVTPGIFICRMDTHYIVIIWSFGERRKFFLTFLRTKQYCLTFCQVES